MNKVDRLFLWLLLIIGVVFFGANVYLTKTMHSENGRLYRVEINRVVSRIAEGLPADMWQQGCTTITAVVPGVDITENPKQFLEGNNQDYVIREVAGEYYRIDYQSQGNEINRKTRVVVNLGIGVMALTMMLFFAYIRTQLLTPFHRLKEVPYELSKGNLSVPLKENKNRYFGKFVWGLNLLRENLEDQRIREYELQKEKKTLILSVSHDIKTPLSAIKLYAKALSRNLYEGIEKQQQIAENIDHKANEIESFVAQIIAASNEEFLDLEVHNGEFYLSALIQQLNQYYTEKMALLQIEFVIEKYADCILKGDLNRAGEVLQNMIENAIKYGDGRRIRILVSSEEDCRLVTVENSGSTLSTNELPHIFESFWRGSNVSGNSGSGLGLYICRQLMNKMNGEVFARCEDDQVRVTAVFQTA